MPSAKVKKVKSSGVHRTIEGAPTPPERDMDGAMLRGLLDRAGPVFPGHAMQRIRTPDGTIRYTYVSPTLQAQLGLDPARITGQAHARHDWIHPEDRAGFVAALHASADSLTPFDQEVRVLAASGRVVWLRSLGYPRRLADRSVVWDGIALDVTDRREAAAAVGRAMADARAAEAEQARLVATMTATLRAPLARAQEASAGLQKQSPMRVAMAELAAAIESLIGKRDGHQLSQPAHDVHGLTARQQEVARLLSEGRSNAEIGEALGISAGTAKLHVVAVMRRLGARNRAHAAVLFGNTHG